MQREPEPIQPLQAAAPPPPQSWARVLSCWSRTSGRPLWMALLASSVDNTSRHNLELAPAPEAEPQLAGSQSSIVGDTDSEFESADEEEEVVLEDDFHDALSSKLHLLHAAAVDDLSAHHAREKQEITAALSYGMEMRERELLASQAALQAMEDKMHARIIAAASRRWTQQAAAKSLASWQAWARHRVGLRCTCGRAVARFKGRRVAESLVRWAEFCGTMGRVRRMAARMLHRVTLGCFARWCDEVADRRAVEVAAAHAAAVLRVEKAHERSAARHQSDLEMLADIHTRLLADMQLEHAEQCTAHMETRDLLTFELQTAAAAEQEHLLRVSIVEAEAERQRSTHVQEISELEQSIRRTAERQVEHLRTLLTGGALRRMRNSALSRAFVAWVHAAWAQQTASVEALAQKEAQARQSAELLATEATEACAAAEAAVAVAQAESTEAQLRCRVELEAEQVAQLAAHAKLTEQTEVLAQQQEKVRQLEQAHVAAEDAARASAEQAAKHADHVETVKTLFHGAAIRRMRHGLVSRAFRSWGDAAVGAIFEKRMKDLQTTADAETQAREQAQDAERQAREKAAVAKATVEALQEAAETSATIMDEAAQAKARVKIEVGARSAAEQAMAAAIAEAADAGERFRAVVETRMAMQAQLAAQGMQLAAEREKAFELQRSRSAMQEEARAATAQAMKHSETIDAVQERWKDAAVRRMQHGFVSRCFRAWSDTTIEVKLGLQIDELQKRADGETEQRRAAQEAAEAQRATEAALCACRAECAAFQQAAQQAQVERMKAEEMVPSPYNIYAIFVCRICM